MFQALSDHSRRDMLVRISAHSLTILQLASAYSMSLPAVMKHVGVLESAGLVRTEKIGRSRFCVAQPAALTELQSWINQCQQLWEPALDRLASLVEENE